MLHTQDNGGTIGQHNNIKHKACKIKLQVHLVS